MSELSREYREFLIANDICPECRGSLDTGWECNNCGFDARPEALATPETKPDHP